MTRGESPRIKKRVRAQFDFHTLEGVCAMAESQFTSYGTAEGEKETLRIFRDNGSSILGVAHMDSCDQGNWARNVHTPDWHFIFAPRLDDRLGVYTITQLLPRLGINVDWLLTTGEEKGKSTARGWEPPKGKKYNWMFSFDRTGVDVVTYRYRDHKFEKLLEDEGFKTGIGSFSDICELESLGCKGFNVGCAYYDYHGMFARMNVEEYLRQVSIFVDFYHHHHHEHLKHEETHPMVQVYGGRGGARGTMYGDDWPAYGEYGSGTAGSTMGQYNAEYNPVRGTGYLLCPDGQEHYCFHIGTRLVYWDDGKHIEIPEPTPSSLARVKGGEAQKAEPFPTGSQGSAEGDVEAGAETVSPEMAGDSTVERPRLMLKPNRQGWDMVQCKNPRCGRMTAYVFQASIWNKCGYCHQSLEEDYGTPITQEADDN